MKKSISDSKSLFLLTLVVIFGFSGFALATPGDMDGDGYVNLEDVNLFTLQWLANDCASFNWCEGADINHSGNVDFNDFALLAQNWSIAIPIWSDEFDGTSVDTSKWVYDVGGGGWGNSELEYYTDGLNVSVSGGNLIIEARRESVGGRSFTSTRMKTKGKFSFQYGTVAIRANIPDLADGLWPALWARGTNGLTWPADGELDIMEMGSAAAIAAGTQNRRTGSAAHWESGGGHASYSTSYTAPSNLNDAFHIWKMDWTPTVITVSLDGTQYWAFNISGGADSDLEEFHQPFYILMNLAVGGTYTGITNVSEITAPFPAKMYIDYVRVYNAPPPPPPPPGVVSQGKAVTASSSELANPAASANDGSLGTRWAASSAAYPQWWRVDLGASYNLTRTDINWYNSSSRAYGYKIEVSEDDITYTTVVDKTGNTTYGDTSDSFTATGGYVRVTVTGCTSGSAFASMYEVKVYGN